MGDWQVDFNEEEMREWLGLVEKAYDRALEYMAADVWGNIKREAPTDHGKLAGSFALEKISRLKWRIYTMVYYAMYVHEGTGIYGPVGHPIVPRRARFLVFEWHGQTWFLRSVRGQKPNPFADRAMDTTAGRVQEFTERAVAETA